MAHNTHNLIHIIPGNRPGGIQDYACDICRHYAGSGSAVAALTRGARIVDSRLEGVRIENAPLRGLADFGSIRELVRMIRFMPEGPLTVHAHRYRDAGMAVIARRLARRPDVRIVASRHVVKRGRDDLLFRMVYRHIDAHIFVSRLAFERFSRSWSNNAYPLPPERIHILHNSINIGTPRILPEPQRGAVTAIYHGPLTDRKGLEMLIDALALLRDTKLRLMISGRGNPDFLDKLRRRTMMRGVMDAIDWRSGNDLSRDMLERIHFGVVPSVESEAFGLSNLRYMACGRPQVATRNGAQAEFLEDGESALLVPPASAAALADAMRRLATDPELRRRLGTNAFHDFCKNHDWNDFIRNLDQIYSPLKGWPNGWG